MFMHTYDTHAHIILIIKIYNTFYRLISCKEFGISLFRYRQPKNWYIRIYIWIYPETHSNTHTHTCMYLHAQIQTHTLTHTCMYLHTHIQTYTHTNTHTCMYLHTHIQTHPHPHTHVCIYTFKHTHTHTRVCIYIHTSSWRACHKTFPVTRKNIFVCLCVGVCVYVVYPRGTNYRTCPTLLVIS